MTDPVHVGPARVIVSRDNRIVVSDPAGRIEPGEEQGFLAADTRLVSRWDLTLGGCRPMLLSSGRVEPWSARFEFVNDRFDDAGGPIEPAAVWLRLDRTVAGGVHEDIDLVSHARRDLHLRLALAIDADFADIFDVRAHEPRTRGRVTTRWSPASRTLRHAYANASFRRTLDVSVRRATSEPAFEDGEIVFDVHLAPKGRWHTCLLWLPSTPGAHRTEVLDCNAVERVGPAPGPARGRRRSIGDAAENRRATEAEAAAVVPHGTRHAREVPPPRARLRSGDPAIDRAWDAAVEDLEALRLEDPAAPGTAVPAAGVPWYATLFGRDALIASGLVLPVFPEYAVGSLRRLAAMQATADDPVRDMEPGKIPHEIRHGELAELGLLPFHPYFGTADATPLFVDLLAEHAAWAGNASLVRRLLPQAQAAMAWIDRYGDRDGDGLQEYGPRAGGFVNQGWKDSHDGIPTESGEVPVPPIALCELQGYAYAAKVRLADLMDELDRPDDAGRLRTEAARLFDRVNDAFWWEAEGTYHLGLDGHKRPIRSVASNAGHLLGAGIVPEDRAARVAARLLAPDMWSGWGIRTLSADHPAYDPFSYHRGSVWPHDNALIAAGFRRAGLAAQAAFVARGIIDAAACFEGSHLPELFAGVSRADTSVPVPYRDACVPQAWAAASLISLVLNLAGVSASRDSSGQSRLDARPALPDWLPDLSVDGLLAGDGAVSLRLRNGAVEIRSNTTGLPVGYDGDAGRQPLTAPPVRPRTK